MNPESELYAKVQIFCPFYEAIIKNSGTLILDDHYFHLRNIEVIECARENEVHSVCLTQHTIHKLQPLGVSLHGASEDIPRTGFRNLAVNPSKQSCHTQSNYWTGWESLFEIVHSC